MDNTAKDILNVAAGNKAFVVDFDQATLIKMGVGLFVIVVVGNLLANIITSRIA